MTEPLDLDALRREDEFHGGLDAHRIRALIDELEHTRAERDERFDWRQMDAVRARAERAEAELAKRDAEIVARQNAAAYAEPKDLR